MSGQHAPMPRIWLCQRCGQLWPCPASRSQLAVRYAGARAALGQLMATAYTQAVGDLPYARPGDLWERFFGWIRSVT